MSTSVLRAPAVTGADRLPGEASAPASSPRVRIVCRDRPRIRRTPPAAHEVLTYCQPLTAVIAADPGVGAWGVCHQIED